MIFHVDIIPCFHMFHNFHPFLFLIKCFVKIKDGNVNKHHDELTRPSLPFVFFFFFPLSEHIPWCAASDKSSMIYQFDQSTTDSCLHSFLMEWQQQEQQLGFMECFLYGGDQAKCWAETPFILELTWQAVMYWENSSGKGERTLSYRVHCFLWYKHSHHG